MKNKISMLLILTMILSVLTCNGLATTYVPHEIDFDIAQYATKAETSAMIASAKEDGVFISDNAVVGYVIVKGNTSSNSILPCIIETDGTDGIKKTMIVDYVMDVNTGEILRSSTYGSSDSMTTVPFITIYYSIDYEKTRSSKGYTFARLGGVSAQYSYKSGYTEYNAPISNLWVTAELYGELVEYPACLDWSFSELDSNVLDDNYCAVKDAGKNGPTSPNMIYSSGVQYPSNRAVWISNAFAGMAFLAEFSANNRTYSDSISIF